MYALICFAFAFLLGVISSYSATISLVSGIIGGVVAIAFVVGGIFCIVKDID